MAFGMLMLFLLEISFCCSWVVCLFCCRDDGDDGVRWFCWDVCCWTWVDMRVLTSRKWRGEEVWWEGGFWD